MRYVDWIFCAAVTLATNAARQPAMRYHEAIAVLSGKVMEFPNSRAAASLIAYCYYYVADYASAIAAYERLVKLCPDVETYKLYLAQALFKGGHYDAATKACQAVGDSEELSHKVAPRRQAPPPPRAACAPARRRRRVPTPRPSSLLGRCCCCRRRSSSRWTT